MSIIDRIRQINKHAGISTRQFCIEVGIANGYLDKVKDVGAEKLMKILNKYNEVSPEWLLTGKGTMLREFAVKNLTENTDAQIKPLADLLSQMHGEVKDLTSQLSMQISENKRLMRENEILRHKEKINIENYNNFEKEKLIKKEKIKDKPPIQSDRRIYSDDPNFTVEKSTR